MVLGRRHCLILTHSLLHRPLDRRRMADLRTFSTTSRLREAAPATVLAESPLPLPPSPTVSPAASAVRLRPYQERAVSDCLTAIAEGTSRIGVSSPTGSGKTTMFTELIARLPNLPNVHSQASDPVLHRPGDRVLIIVGAIELALQAASAVTRAHPHLHVEIEQGSKYRATGTADVTVATYQTLTRSEDRLSKFRSEGLKAIIVDEAHHAASPSYISLLANFDSEVGLSRDERREALAQQAAAVAPGPSTSFTNTSTTVRRRIPIIGFSATFSRHDGLALGRVFDRIVYHRDFLEMIDEQWLCPVRFTSIRSNLDLSAVKVSSTSGDFLPKSLASFTNIAPVNRLIVRSWLDRAADRRSTLVFCIDVQHVIDLTAEFREAGIDARYLHGGTSMKERKQLLEDFKQGKYRVLVNCAILTEGFDLPQIDAVLLARPTRSRNLFSQMIGRGLRLSPQTGKRDCLILDLVGTIERGVICTPTLFGLDPEEQIEGMSLEELKERAEEASQRGANVALDDCDDPTRITFVDYASPHELQSAVSRKIGDFIYRLSPNAWVDCGAGVYILDIPRKGFIRVQRGEPILEGDAAEEGSDTEEDTPSFTPAMATSTWSATFTPQNIDYDEAVATSNRRSFSPYRRAISILGDADAEQAPSLEACIRVCDTYATKHVLRSGPMNQLLRRDAEWRKKAASPSQKALVAKRLGFQPDAESFTNLKPNSKAATNAEAEVDGISPHASR
ncbi:P-loop containing nucleoside triphosphate hydrolase protein, partial [Microstroma glucosiphilum]